MCLYCLGFFLVYFKKVKEITHTHSFLCIAMKPTWIYVISCTFCYLTSASEPRHWLITRDWQLVQTETGQRMSTCHSWCWYTWGEPAWCLYSVYSIIVHETSKRIKIENLLLLKCNSRLSNQCVFKMMKLISTEIFIL